MNTASELDANKVDIMKERFIESMRGTPPPKSTDEAWREHYRLQEQYIDELEREIDRLKMRILSLEVAGQNVVYQATEMWKHGAIREWMDLTRKEDL